MIFYEERKPVEHIMLDPICIFPTWCAHANTVI